MTLTYGALMEEIRRARVRTVQNELALEEDLPDDFIEQEDERTCAYCGEHFSRAPELTLHRWENLWEPYVLRRKGAYVCRLCKKPFKTKDEFLYHWYHGEPWHEHHAASEFIRGKRQGTLHQTKWLMDPVEEKRLEKRMRNDPKLRKLRYGVGAAADFEKLMDYVTQYNAMLISETYGKGGSGKSRFIITVIYNHLIPRARKRLAQDWLQVDENYAAAVINRDELRAMGNKIGLVGAAIDVMKHSGSCMDCNKIQSYEEGTKSECCNADMVCEWREPQVFYTFSVAESLQAIAKAHSYDNIMQDEDKGLMGKGKDTTIKRLKTILKLFRARRVNFHFISPDVITYIVNSNVQFEVFYKAVPLKKGITRLGIADSDGDFLGWMQLKVVRENDPRLHDYVENYKNPNLLKTQEDLAAESMSFDMGDVEAEGKRAAKVLIDTWTLKRALKTPKGEILKAMPGCGVKGQEDYQNLVGASAHWHINLWGEAEKSGIPPEEMDIPDEIDPVQTIGFSLDEMDYLDVIEKDWPDNKKKYIMAYRKYSAKESGWKSYKEIVQQEEMDMKSKSAVSDRFAEITGAIAKLQGDKFEMEMFDLYAKSTSVEMMKPNVREPAPKEMPDRIAFLKDGTVRICAWKCVPSNPTIPLTSDKEGKKPCPEIVKAREMVADGAKVQLVLEGLCEHGFFSVEIDPDTTKKFRNIKKRECSAFPPDMDLVLGEK